MSGIRNPISPKIIENSGNGDTPPHCLVELSEIHDFSQKAAKSRIMAFH
jgi:hypothetical protein